MTAESSRPKAQHLAMRPDGLAGRLFGYAMQWLNAPSYRNAEALLGERRHGRILEIGFGTGKLVERLLKGSDACFVAGVDPAETMVEMARRRRVVRQALGRSDLRVGTAGALPWPDGDFDAVLALHCFQFWEAPAEALAEIARVLRPDGLLVLLLRDHGKRAPDWLPNPVSRSGREAEAAQSMLEAAGFEVELFPPSGGASLALVGSRIRSGAPP